MDPFVSTRVKDLLRTEYAISVYKIIGMFYDFAKAYDAYIYFKTNEELATLSEGKKDKIKSIYLSFLNQHGYMPNEIEEIRFYFDSDENVQANYKGNYFYATK